MGGQLWNFFGSGSCSADEKCLQKFNLQANIKRLKNTGQYFDSWVILHVFYYTNYIEWCTKWYPTESLNKSFNIYIMVQYFHEHKEQLMEIYPLWIACSIWLPFCHATSKTLIAMFMITQQHISSIILPPKAQILLFTMPSKWKCVCKPYVVTPSCSPHTANSSLRCLPQTVSSCTTVIMYGYRCKSVCKINCNDYVDTLNSAMAFQVDCPRLLCMAALAASMFCGLCTLAACPHSFSNIVLSCWNCCWSLWIVFGGGAHHIPKWAWNHFCISRTLFLGLFFLFLAFFNCLHSALNCKSSFDRHLLHTGGKPRANHLAFATHDAYTT